MKSAEIICKCGMSFPLFEDWEDHMIIVHGARREDMDDRAETLAN